MAGGLLACGLAHAMGIGQTMPAQSSTLGGFQTEESTARKLAEVDHEPTASESGSRLSALGGGQRQGRVSWSPVRSRPDSCAFQGRLGKLQAA